MSPREDLLILNDLASIADEADPLDAEALGLHEEVALLATELAEHQEALERWSLVADRAEPPLRRASALLAASQAAYGLARTAEARDLLERSRQIDSGDEVLRLEQDTHEAAILLWLEQQATDGRDLARDAVAAATRLATGSGGVRALDARTRRAYIDALRLDREAAVMKGDQEGVLRAAKAREAAARGVDLEQQLTASLALCLALRQNGRVREAIARGRQVWLQAQRHLLPRLVVDAGFWLARSLAVAGDLLERPSCCCSPPRRLPASAGRTRRGPRPPAGTFWLCVTRSTIFSAACGRAHRNRRSGTHRRLGRRCGGRGGLGLRPGVALDPARPGARAGGVGR